MKKIINNLSKFIRLKICIFISAIGMIGYLIFNPLDIKLIFVALTSFFGGAGSYSFNSMKDKEEDLINRKEINPLSLSKKGLLVVATCFLIGLFFSLFLPLYSILFYSFGVVISIIYSLFKIKKYFLIKNFYTGFSAALMFLIGAANISFEIIQYYLLISFFVFIGSVISDLRDYMGDKITGIKTLPVVLGYDKTRKIIFLLLGIFSFLAMNSIFIILLPFSLSMTFFVYKNNTIVAHSLSGYSLILLVFLLMMWGV